MSDDKDIKRRLNRLVEGILPKHKVRDISKRDFHEYCVSFRSNIPNIIYESNVSGFQIEHWQLMAESHPRVDEALQAYIKDEAQKNTREILELRALLGHLNSGETVRPSGISDLPEDVRGVELVGRDLSNIDLAGEDLTNADLTNANLEDANLQYACLEGARLDGANLRGSLMMHTNLTRASFYQADCRHADFSHACVEDANLRQAEFTEHFSRYYAGVNFESARNANHLIENLDAN